LKKALEKQSDGVVESLSKPYEIVGIIKGKEIHEIRSDRKPHIIEYIEKDGVPYEIRVGGKRKPLGKARYFKKRD